MFIPRRIISRSICFSVTALTGVALLLFHFVQKPSDRRKISAVEIISKHSTNKPHFVNILAYGFWKTGEQDQQSWLPTGNVTNCPYTNCHLHIDMDSLKKSDVFILNGWTFRNKVSLEFCRRASFRQRMHILYLNEAPVRFKSNQLSTFDSCFHFLSTYMSTSALPHPHGRAEIGRPHTYAIRASKLSNRKTKPIAWAVSRCQTQSGRERYVTQLQQYIGVDIYGACGNWTCSKQESQSCYELFERKYFFYLSFENSMCEDYISEKLWKILRYNIVPVVMGGAKYKKYLPSNSYIDVRDFSSPQELAVHLEQIMKNETLYLSYFYWKQKYHVTKPSFTCELCKFANEHWDVVDKDAVINSVKKVWSAKKLCHQPKW